MGKDVKRGYETSEDDSDQQVNQIIIDYDDSPMKNRNHNGEMDEDLKAQIELEDAIRPRQFILSSRSNKRFVWDVIIIIFAIQNGITLPLQIAFDA